MNEAKSFQVRATPDAKAEIDRIGKEWRMNITETISALVEHWNQSNDRKRIDAIRRREVQPA